MTPCSNGNALSSNETTTTIVDKDGLSYVRCESLAPFVNPTIPSDVTLTAKEVNDQLNLNLGLRIDPNNAKLRKVIRFLNDFFISWWERYLFLAWNKMPLRFKQMLTFSAWKCYLPMHKFFLGRTTAIHPAASEEYHALTSVLWWGRLFPVTIQRMRFSLGQLSVWTKSPVVSRVEHVRHDMDVAVPTEQAKHCRVNGLYVHTQHKPTDKVIFWLYGGAFLSGDVHGNLGPAESVGRKCGKDVFLPTYRLLPECEFDDMLWDVCLAYSFLVHVRRVQPSNIILLGISSGGGLCARLTQYIAELQQQHKGGGLPIIPLTPPYIANVLDADMMPAGAVLMCPFVDYTEPKGTFAEYPAHDLIVNQSVMEVGLPYFAIALGDDENRTRYSPVHRSMAGLPPLCVVVSEHEIVYDQTIALVNRAREAGVPVTLGVWKYMCHVFCFLSSFVPEGEQSMEFVCHWIQEQWKETSLNPVLT